MPTTLQELKNERGLKLTIAPGAETNFHKNSFIRGGKPVTFSYGAVLELTQPRTDSDVARQARDIAEVCAWAEATGWTVRAVGSKWSFSDCMAPGAKLENDRQSILVRTDNFFHLKKSSLAKVDEHLVYVTGGAKLHQVNVALERMKCSLMTSGSSDGQSIAGALGTGVHGSAYRFGAMHNAVRAYHLAIPGKHVFVMREGDDLSADVRNEFVDAVGKPTVIVDPALFDAISVSFGSFGILVGVVMQVDQKYALRVVRRSFPAASLPKLIDTLKADGNLKDVQSNLHALAPTDEAHHCQVLVNPYDADNYKIVVMHKRYNFPPADVFHWPEVFDASSVSLLNALWSVLDVGDALFGPLVSGRFNGLPDVTAWGYRTDVFGAPEQPLPVHSFAVGLALDHVIQTLKITHQVVQEEKFPGAAELRFVKASPAHLAINRFLPITAVLGFDGIDKADSWDFTELFLNKLRAAKIPHTFHWGKMTHMVNDAVANRATLETMYGHRLKAWLDARDAFLGAGKAVFDSTFVRRHGVTK